LGCRVTEERPGAKWGASLSEKGGNEKKENWTDHGEGGGESTMTSYSKERWSVNRGKRGFLD